MYARTDLAMEERELWQRSAQAQTALSGVWAREQERGGVRMTVVKILNDEGARQLHKPVGNYWTMELLALARREKNAFPRAAQALAAQLRTLTRGKRRFLVAGLGNDAITPDAVGPQALKSLIVTRHLCAADGTGMEGMRCVSAVQPGVLGTTGLESVELVRGAVQSARPEMIFVIDALAACDPERVCTTVQITDTGIVPGSGVGNSRAAFNEQTLGVPVIALGVPTVVDARTMLAQNGELCNFHKAVSGMILTPRDIDERVREISRLIGYGLNLALHPALTMEDVRDFLA